MSRVNAYLQFITLSTIYNDKIEKKWKFFKNNFSKTKNCKASYNIFKMWHELILFF